MSNMRAFILFCGAALVASAWCGDEPPKAFDLSDEVVCKINTESVSKRQIEERMEEIVMRLLAWKKAQEDSGQWNDATRKQFDELYIPPFRDALRRVVRERLMLQDVKKDKAKFQIDERAYEKRLGETVERLRKDGLLGGKNFTMAEVQKRIRENMLLDNFRGQFAMFLDFPTRPEVTRRYEQNVERYQRKAGVKVRLIRIDRFVTDPLTGRQKANQKAFEDATRLREDIVSGGGRFDEIARQRSNDEESKSRGGLIVINGKDTYIDPDSYNPKLADAVRELKAGEISKIFPLGESWAFALVEERRPAGAIPLMEIYDDIYRELFQHKTHVKEDEWFRKTLSKSLVVQVVEGKETTLPVEFFFPDDAQNRPTEVAKPK